MLSNPIILLSASAALAAIPVVIWLIIFFRKTEGSKKTIALIFGLGCLTAPALLLLQVVWDKNPNFSFDIASLITENIQTQSLMYVTLFIFFGAMEEIIKQYVITAVDKRTTLIKTISDTIRYSLTAALGFAFSENIYYLYIFWPSISLGELAGLYAFRSVFTACAHMIFSGIFGYFYAMGKFSIYLAEQEEAAGKSSISTRIIAKIFNIPLNHAYQQRMVIKGLLIAIVMHATYNFVLQMNYTIPVIIFVICGYLYMRYLLKRKAGHLILTTDITDQKIGKIAKKDKDVVIDLLGMWFNEKRYVDVIHVCERLLERDPDNQIVKIFKAKAMDKMDEKDIYRKTLGSIINTKEDLSETNKNKLSKYIEEKEMFEKVKRMIKKQMQKEGKRYIEYGKTMTEEEEIQAKSVEEEKQRKEKLRAKTSTKVPKKFTGKGTFKLN